MMPVQSIAITSKQYFSASTIVHFAMFMGQLLFAMIAYYLHSSGNFNSSLEEGYEKIFYLLIAAVSVAGLTASIVIFKNQLPSAKEKHTLNEKLSAYRILLIVKYALLEGSSITLLVGYFITGDVLFLAAAGAVMALFLFNRPTIDRTANDLQLREGEKIAINDPGAIVEEGTMIGN
jgi:hypothetical protein